MKLNTEGENLYGIWEQNYYAVVKTMIRRIEEDFGI